MPATRTRRRPSLDLQSLEARAADLPPVRRPDERPGNFSHKFFGGRHIRTGDVGKTSSPDSRGRW
jgi:hypothetical protein